MVDKKDLGSRFEKLPLRECNTTFGFPKPTYAERVFNALAQDRANNLGKKAQRKALLEKNPALRKTVQKDPLQGIINFVDFRCSPYSSVARREAIEGSDIDGGLVVLSEPICVDRQIAFVKELRRQGFAVYHPTEIEDIEKQRNIKMTLLPRDIQGVPIYDQEAEEINKKAAEVHGSGIEFHTKEELQAMVTRESFEHPALMYVGGVSVPLE